MVRDGYYRYPAIFKDTVVFVSEGDLWRVDLPHPTARRLTFNKGAIKSPVFSPDGLHIAFTSSDEGTCEVYVMSANGGERKRLTYMGDDSQVLCWTKEGIYFSSSYGQPFAKYNVIWRIDGDGGLPERLDIGPANYISFKGDTLKNGAVLQRHGYREYGYWKRYRGGTAGDIWIDPTGKGTFNRLLDLKADLARPLWVGDKIIFISDHEGIGNLYQCDIRGQNIKRLTHHKDYYVRSPNTDGHRVVYHAGGDLWVLDLKTEKSTFVKIDYYSDCPERSRKCFNASQYLQGYSLHPKGNHLAVVTRGKACTFDNWEGPVIQVGKQEGIRYRLPTWLPDGKRLVLVSDDAGEENFQIYDVQTAHMISEPKKALDVGRILYIMANPKQDTAIIFNHRHEIWFLDLKTWATKRIDHSAYHVPTGGSWSPDGKWFTYGASKTRQKMVIKLFEAASKKVVEITNPVLIDESPVFDPEGKFIYFISHRHFDPVMDAMHFELSFAYGAKIYAIPLQKDTPTPFLKIPSPLAEEEDKKKDKKAQKEKEEDSKEAEKEIKVTVDLEGIQHRLLEFPIGAGSYSHLIAAKGKIYFISYALEGVLEVKSDEGELHSSLEVFDFETLKTDSVLNDVLDVQISDNSEMLLVWVSKRLRAFKVGEKPEEDATPSKKSGWIDLNRIKLMVTPSAEWGQMFKEAWRLQRDHYWTPDMSEINWISVYDRYAPLLERVNTREEFSDLVWEMQGELGTSHAYVFGGDLKRPPQWNIGSLGADYAWDERKQAYKIINITHGDYWDVKLSSPFVQAGRNVKEGDYLLSINKQKLTKKLTPPEVLFNRFRETVELEVADEKLKNRRTLFVQTLSNQHGARYRDWVESNRAYVHEKTKGAVGYIHIPDMGAEGYAEFHRSFLQEVDCQGLIVDVRFNGGGFVSQLLLEKLARRRLGYDVTRWQGTIPYPQEAPMGPMVAITNEYAGSDGDMFSHNFKAMGLGRLIGKRTWGGVVGIWPRYGLVDGGMTTQPEFSFWFKDVGWSIENHGVDPDIEVEIMPQDYQSGRDPQLDRSLQEIMALIKKHDYFVPDVSTRPSLKLPKKLI